MTGGATFAAALALLAPGASGASRDPASLAIAAWPARVVVVAPGRTTIHVDNPSGEPVVIDAAPSGYELDLRGRPRLRAAGTAGAWLAVRPAHIAVAPRSTTAFTVTVARPPAARPGDHALVVLLTTRLPAGRLVLAHLRVGVVVVARIPGVVVRRLTLGSLTVRRGARTRALDVVVANRGSLDEWIGRRRLTVRLLRGGRLVATIQAAPRRLLAGTHGLVELRCPRSLRGRLTAVVELAQPSNGVARITRTIRLRL